MAETTTEVRMVREILAERWGWLLAFGVFQTVAGFFAVGVPMAATVVSTAFLGWVLAFAGAAQLVHAFQVQGWKGFLLHIVGAVLYVGAGVVLLVNPLEGALTLTLLMAGFFIVEGVVRCGLAIQMRPEDGWLWFLLGGFAGIVLGVMVWSEWPGSAVWAIGLLLGINLVFSGTSLIALAMGFRAAAKDAA